MRSWLAALALTLYGCSQPAPTAAPKPTEAKAEPEASEPRTPPARPGAGMPDSGFVIGEPFPVQVLPTLDGGTASVASFAGKKIILHVFASW